MKIENGFRFKKLSKSVMNKNIYIVASKWNDDIVSPMIKESLSYMKEAVSYTHLTLPTKA